MSDQTINPAQSENEEKSGTSDNIIENVKYIKKLTLQRNVLNKLMGSELSPLPENKDNAPGDPD